MSAVAKIQRCDSSVNPIMGCTVRELFPEPGKILTSIDEAVAATGAKITGGEGVRRAIYNFSH